MTIKIYNIKWDTSSFSEEDELQTGICVPDLPSETEIAIDATTIVDLDHDPAEIAGEYLAESYEYPAIEFNYELIED